MSHACWHGGPVPLVSDEELLILIRADLERSHFVGEGHRKVWARLRVRDGVRVSRKRVLRIMRENHHLSPHRARRASGAAHEGRIITDAPNVMWGTDGTQVLTVEEGNVWIFAAVEHWNAECVGWHVAKTGDRFAALEPVAMGLGSRRIRCNRETGVRPQGLRLVGSFLSKRVLIVLAAPNLSPR